MKSGHCGWFGIVMVAAAGLLRAQLPPAQEWTGVAGRIECLVQEPHGQQPALWVPVAVVLPRRGDVDGARAALAGIGRALAARSFVVVIPVLDAADAKWADVFTRLRRDYRIEQGGLHAVIDGDTARAVEFVLAQRTEFQTVTLGGAAAKADRARLVRLPARRVRTFEVDDADRLANHVAMLHSVRSLPAPAGDVAKVLDDFHDAAAVGDEQRYFAILPDDALFLGTDGTERWTGAQFRKFAMPYFQRDSAWTYVCLQRHVDVDAGGEFAWFDETFDNAAYGECRGSGVMQKRDGRWVLRQYHLTVPVPNDVTRSVAARIRAFQDQVPLVATTIVLVRHAEKVDDSADASLSDAGKARAEKLATVLRDLPIAAVYTSHRQRTAQTVAPLCGQRALQPVEAGRGREWAERFATSHRGQVVLVCGHSDTVPEMLQQLGITTPVTIAADEFDRLFVVTLRGDEPPRLLSLRY